MLGLSTLGHVSSVDTVVNVAVVFGPASLLAGTARAHGESQVRVLVANHGAGVIWRIVGGGADCLSSRTFNWNACWIVRIIRHRWNDAHASRGEWVAVDVGKIIVDLAVSPCELELGDSTRGSVVWRKLDGDADAFLAIFLAVAALELGHAGRVTLADRSIVDREAAVVDDCSGTHGESRWSKGKQHGCACSS